MQKLNILFAFLISVSCVYGQKTAVVTSVKETYAVINKGLAHGMKKGTKFRLNTPDNQNEYGDVLVIRALRSVSAIRLLNFTAGFKLTDGDVAEIAESPIADELPFNIANEMQQTRTTRRHQVNQEGFIMGSGPGIAGIPIQANPVPGTGTVTPGLLLTDFKLRAALRRQMLWTNVMSVW